MRDLVRNKREIYYSAIIGVEPIHDEYGNDTLENRTLFGPPISLSVNVSPSIGKRAIEVFGSQTEYSRTVSITGSCSLTEGAKVWIGADATTQPNNYIVVKVADSKNGYLVALREVAGHE